MRCAFPVQLASMEHKVACGRCMPCRHTTRQKKAGRILLEAAVSGVSSFVTLTHGDWSLPYRFAEDGVPVPSLDRRSLQLCIKRVRRQRDAQTRYFAVGEYGDHGKRPHYHAVVFGCDAVEAAQVFRKCWTDPETKTPHGGVDVKELTADRAAYIAGYTVKKMTRLDPDVDGPQEPEFMRQSLRPAVGCSERVLRYLEELHETRGGAEFIATHRDVCPMYRIGGRMFPLDRTLRAKVRVRLGLPEEGDPERTRFVVDGGPEEMAVAEAAHRKMWWQRKKGVM